MIRAAMGDQAYWVQWGQFRLATIRDEEETFKSPSENPVYRPQYVLNNTLHRLRYIVTLYSSGAPIRELSQHFSGLLDAWELSNRLSDEVCREHGLQSCRDWDFSLSNLNHYNWCFWLVGLALCLEVPEAQWRRLLVLLAGEGEDVLLDRVIASRSPGRRIGHTLLHAKPYGRLLQAVQASKEQQAALLKDFVDYWYAELKRPPPPNRKAPTIQPFWYIWGDPERHPIEKGSYFGRWCIEAAAAVKAFGLDDHLCLGHEHYPGDLLRPDGPSTHPARDEPNRSWLSRLFAKN
ncbi:PoNi-like cognate immunity protein [Aquincola tertiaricarbonis]|uniref:PoNi-like cognate immunity protein n=1 Tax=Aquincola tertiaricarbonis TaxID=391953 RepID=A0ABY4S6B5_AQUTE|nr:PoNe immunity protein domain-containing protein [Aquincola tertiaricarbonis]URI07451.1 PoNi-like cognate immunity protein [Aquincola tertiaricarbonis]